MADEKSVSIEKSAEIAASLAASAAASAMAKRRLALLGPKGRRELAAKAGAAGWAKLSPKRRSLEMRRRAITGKRNRAKAALLRAAGEKAALRAQKAKAKAEAALKG